MKAEADQLLSSIKQVLDRAARWIAAVEKVKELELSKKGSTKPATQSTTTSKGKGKGKAVANSKGKDKRKDKRKEKGKGKVKNIDEEEYIEFEPSEPEEDIEKSEKTKGEAKKSSPVNLARYATILDSFADELPLKVNLASSDKIMFDDNLKVLAMS